MPRIRFLLVFGLLIAGVLLASMGKPDPRVSFTSLLSLWSDALRDADQPGMRLTRLSDADEMGIGNDLAAHMHAYPDAYLQDVGEALLPNIRRPGIRYEFRLVESPAVNAFALPGGRVFVTTAMFDALESEAELAAVLGHEIAHVDLRHCVERYQYEYRLKQAGAPLTGWMIEVVHRLATMGFAPYQELEADAQGEVLAIKAGYDPGAAEALFERMKTRLHETTAPPPSTPAGEIGSAAGQAVGSYFRTHPPFEERARQLREITARNQRDLRGESFYVGKENLRQRKARSREQFAGELRTER